MPSFNQKLQLPITLPVDQLYSPSIGYYNTIFILQNYLCFHSFLMKTLTELLSYFCCYQHILSSVRSSTVSSCMWMLLWIMGNNNKVLWPEYFSNCVGFRNRKIKTLTMTNTHSPQHRAQNLLTNYIYLQVDIKI